MPGPDHKASLNAAELKSMVKAIRNIEIALGTGIKKPNKSEEEIENVVRKKLVASRDIEAGKIISEKDIAIKRSNEGLVPEFLEIIAGKKIIKEIKEDEGFTWQHFKEE